MMIYEFSTCCNLSLKHGTIIIGILQSIFAFIFLILSAAYAEYPQELMHTTDAPPIVQHLTYIRIILIIISISCAIQFIFSILIIFGAVTNRPILLLPWLTFNPICLITYVIPTLIAIFHHVTFKNELNVISHLIMILLVSFIVSYKIFIVYSYFKQLKRLNF